MAAITEDYVSFETAKLLKQKGFPQKYDVYHSMVYNEKDYEDEYEVQRMVLQTRLVKAGTLSSYPVGVPEPKCYCPTLQVAMKWLRKKYNIHIEPRYFPMPNIYRYVIIRSPFTIENIDSHPQYFNSYEEAVEAALKYCLEHLI